MRSAASIVKPYVNLGPKLSPDRKLNAEQRRLFNENQHLAKRAARKFISLYPGVASFEEIEQNALIGLWRAASRFDSTGDFGPFALQRVNWYLKQAFFDRFAGNSAVVNARRFEVPASEIVRAADDAEYTRADEAEARMAGDELSSLPGEYRLAARLYDIRTAIAKAPGLDSRERRVLRLKYLLGLDHEAVAARIGYSTVVVKRTLRSAILKLRAYFAAQGALPLDAPIPNAGNPNGCPRRGSLTA
jgi:RNA polymerase sigma factor (sigma-70 family)